MKKKVLLAVGCGLIATSAWAQQKNHMFDFNADSIVQGTLNFGKTKNRGTHADNGSDLKLLLNYAYRVAPRMQVGVRTNYVKDSTKYNSEGWGMEVGAIWNFQEDFMNTAYASVYLGMQWDNTYGALASSDEIRKGTLAVGKRFDLKVFGLDHVTWSPEIALQALNSSTGSALDYAHSIQFRFLQFSVLF